MSDESRPPDPASTLAGWYRSRQAHELAALLGTHPEALERDKTLLYFVQAHRQYDDPVKIGKTGRATERDRLANLQGASPKRLAVVARIPGGDTLERRLHARFATVRLNGEWFSISDELRTLIATVREAYGFCMSCARLHWAPHGSDYGEEDCITGGFIAAGAPDAPEECWSEDGWGRFWRPEGFVLVGEAAP